MESGTLEEFLLAYDLWKLLEKPHIMFYFKEVKIRSMKDLEDEQLRKILDLKDKIDQGKLLIFSEFSTPEEFRKRSKTTSKSGLLKTQKLGKDRRQD